MWVEEWRRLVSSAIVAVMTLEEAQFLIVEGINDAAYKGTDSPFHDSGKIRPEPKRFLALAIVTQQAV